MTNRVLPTDIRDLKRLRPGVDDTSGAAIVVRQGDEAKVIEADWLIQADLNSRTAAESARIAQRAAEAVTAPLQVVAGVAPQIQALAPVADKIADLDAGAVNATAANLPAILAAPAAAQSAQEGAGQVAADKAIVLQAKADTQASAELVGSYKTLAAANAALGSIANDRVISVTADGTNNGTYVKRNGVLEKDSDATVGALDARQRETTRALSDARNLRNYVAIDDVIPIVASENGSVPIAIRRSTGEVLLSLPRDNPVVADLLSRVSGLAARDIENQKRFFDAAALKGYTGTEIIPVVADLSGNVQLGISRAGEIIGRLKELTPRLRDEVFSAAANLLKFDVASATVPIVTDQDLRIFLGVDAATGLPVGTMVDALDLSIPKFGDAIVRAGIVANGLTVSTDAVLCRNGTFSDLKDVRTLTPASGSNVRYDVLWYDAVAGVFGVTQGTERATDASHFIPPLPDSRKIELYRLRVAGASVTPVARWNVVNSEVRSNSVALEAERARSRLCLPKAIGKIRRKQSLSILGFGDSITAIQSGSPVASVVNGPLRDRGAAPLSDANHYFRDAYGADVVDAVPLYTALQLGRPDDGAGAIHTRVGWNWTLVRELEKSGYVLGSDLFYDNMGIGGASSSLAVTAEGAATTWLSNAAAHGADIVIVGLGQNEQGNAETEGRLIFIAETLKAAGSEVIFMGCTQRRSPYSGWAATNRAIKRAAVYTQSGFIPMEPFYDPRFVGAMGLSTLDASAANAINHPGFLELEVIGLELVKLLLA